MELVSVTRSYLDKETLPCQNIGNVTRHLLAMTDDMQVFVVGYTFTSATCHSSGRNNDS